MKSLKEKKWGQFRIGDVYSVKRPAARNKDDYKNGRVPFIASGAVNNGVMKYCTPRKNENLDQKNCITVSPVDGSSFYQEYDFLGRGGAGSSILMLYSDNNEKLSGQFIARMITNTCSKYTYGHMGNKDSIKREFIMLPITDDGKPDYEYMAEYIRQQQNNLLNKYRDYISKKLQELGDLIEIPALNEKKWGSFRLTDIFPEIERGKRLKSADHIKGETPYVSSTAENNGVDDFISNEQGVRKFSECISFANSGSVGSAFYEPFSFVASDHITHLKNNDFTQKTYMFISTMLSKLSKKYNFNREINDYRISRERVLLPTTDCGEPDYAYMEQYVKNIMIRKYHQYLDYINKSYN